MLRYFIINFLTLLILSVNSWALSVYVISAGDFQSNQAIIDALVARWHDPVLGVGPSEWDGSQADLSNYDVVVLSVGTEWEQDMPIDGQVALISFVTNGGGLVTGEWLVWSIKSGSFQYLKQMVPAASIKGKFVSATSTIYIANKKKPDSILNNGLPCYFRFPTANIDGSESLFKKKRGATEYYRSSAAKWLNGVVGWVKGGRVISFSTIFSFIELSDKNYEPLFVNAVEWAGASTPQSL